MSWVINCLGPTFKELEEWKVDEYKRCRAKPDYPVDLSVPILNRGRNAIEKKLSTRVKLLILIEKKIPKYTYK